ncbi:hypothetical protein HZB00_03975 [Candidatus Woesearchaeota archaeon]|nr:hypothetical protein [Candidatus Woesearchaeota archaeon]
MKKGWILLFIFLLYLLPAHAIPTCEPKDGCKVDCFDGDADCSCALQKGYKCTETQTCKTRLLKNWDGFVCCPLPCESGNVVETTKVKELTNEYVQKREPVTIPVLQTQTPKKNVVKESTPLIVFFLGIIAITIEFYLWQKKGK